MGEPAGIGGEIALKAWLGRGEGMPPFYLIDDPGSARAVGAKASAGAVPVRADRQPARGAGGIRRGPSRCADRMAVRALPGAPDPARRPGRSLGAIEAAVRDVRSGRAAALVTNPIHKDSLYRAGFRIRGTPNISPSSPGYRRSAGHDARLPRIARRAGDDPSGAAAGDRGSFCAGDRSCRPHHRRGIAAGFRCPAAPILAVAGLNPHAGRGRRSRPRGDRHHRSRRSPSCAPPG